MNKKRLKAKLRRIKYFFVNPDNEEAKNYVGLVYRQAFQQRGIDHTLIKVRYGGESGAISFQITGCIPPKPFTKALMNAHGRLLRRGHQYPIGYVTYNNKIVDIQHEHKKQQERKQKILAARKKGVRAKINRDELPERPKPVQSQQEIAKDLESQLSNGL